MLNGKAAVLLKQAKKLKRKKKREDNDPVIVEGKSIIDLAVSSKAEVLAIFGIDDRLIRQFDSAGLPAFTISEKDFRELTSTVSPQSICALVKYQPITLNHLADTSRLFVYLEEIRDPGNLGTIIRTADAFGADAVILSPNCVDPLNDKCIRSSAGSLFNVAVITNVSLVTLKDWLNQKSATLYVTSLDGKVDLTHLNIPPNNTVVWGFGNESRGVSEDFKDVATELIKIPMQGKAESLNAAIAVGVCLYATSIQLTSREV